MRSSPTFAFASAIPDPFLYRLVTGLSRFPARLTADPERRGLLDDADRFSLGHGNAGWGFGAGPLVVLMHGWGGAASQMATLARRLSGHGMRAVIFDVTGHGQARRRPATFADFGRDLARCLDVVGHPVALVGHSAGALCMMASRQKYGLQVERYVCLAAPRGPYPPINDVRRLVGDRPAVLDRCREWWSGQLGASWHDLDNGAAYSYTGHGELLAVGDVNDPVVEAGDPHVITAGWPGRHVLRTTGLGHRRILSDVGVADTVATFLAPVAAS